MLRSITLVATILVALILAPSAGVVASHPTWGDYPSTHTYSFIHSTGTWKDDKCPEPGGYAVMFWENALHGDRTRVCHGVTNSAGSSNLGRACEVPMSGGYHQWPVTENECIAWGINAFTLHDKVTGLEVLSGVGSGECLIIYENENWTGAFRQFNAGTVYFNLSDIGFNDRMDSWQVVDCKAGSPIY